MTVNSQRVNLEIQVENLGNYTERCMFHWARMFTASLPSGDDYSELPKSIVISILDFALFSCEDVHSEFAVLEIKRHEIMSDKQRYHFFELPKMSDIDFIDITSEKDLWLALFNAETEQELEKLARTGGDVMVQAVEAYRGITATEEFQHLEWLREKTRHDEAQAISNAKQIGEQLADKKWQNVVAEKDTTIAEKDTAIAEKDTTIADQARIISELRKLLNEK